MTTLDTADIRTAALRVPRRRGALGGLLLVVMGAWAALAPFVGPYMDFAFTPDKSWTWTSARGWLEVLPGCVIGVGGLVLLLTTNRLFAVTATWYAMAGGAWLIIGPQLIHVVNTGSPGTPTGSTDGLRAGEWIADFYGLGALVLIVAATLHGRLSMRSLGDVQAARAMAMETAPEVPVTRTATPAAVPAAAPAAAVPADAPPAPAEAPSGVMSPEQRHASRWHFPPARRATPTTAAPETADPTTEAATAGRRHR